MQKCKTSQRRATNVNNYKNVVAKIWQKDLHHWHPNVPKPSKDWTDDVKKAWKWSKKVWYMLWKLLAKFEEIPADLGACNLATTTWPSKPTADEHPADTIASALQKRLRNLRDRNLKTGYGSDGL